MAHFSEDSFDRLPAHSERVGAHRGQRRHGGWAVFGWAVLATVVLIGLGIGYLAIINNNNQFTDAFGGGTTAAVDTPTPTAEPVAPVTDPALPVTILNGTEVVGLAGRVGEAATAGGWTVGTMANASSTDFATTTVYYSDAVNEAAALGLSQLLGGVPTELSSSFEGAPLTVVLGTDYAGPGAEAPEAPVE
jgi:hypothetical protein